MDVAVLLGAGALLIALGLWGRRRGSFRSMNAGLGFMIGGAITILVALLLAAGIVPAE